MALPIQSTEVSIEALQEYPIQSFQYDGKEISTEPLSMSENLSRLAERIDFTSDGGENVNEKNKEEAPATFQTSSWPWESVRNKLRSALTETSVLLDILTIARDRRYMSIESINNEVPDTRIPLNLISKKKGLNSAAQIIQDGIDRMRKTLQEQQSRSMDFHQELYNMRQRDGWKLRKVGNTIIGDLSYKSAGSRYTAQGTFEVKKSEDEDATHEGTSQSPGRAPPQINSSIQVSVPTELEGFVYIYASLIKDDGKLNFSDLSSCSPPIQYARIGKQSWQTHLDNAQYVIFCKEIFHQLSREAITMKFPLPNVVVGDQVLCHLYDDVKLIIAMCRTLPDEDDLGRVRSNFTPTRHFVRPTYSYVLEHNLHQLLREIHSRTATLPLPHPITGHIGATKRRRLAGPYAFGKIELEEAMPSISLLQQIIIQSKHYYLHTLVTSVLDDIAKEHIDPQIIVHHGAIGTAHQSMIRVFIFNSFSETTRCCLLFKIESDILKCVSGNSVFVVNRDAQMIRNILEEQICHHKLNSITLAIRLTNWNILSQQSYIPVRFHDDMKFGGKPGYVLVASPNRRRVLLVTCYPKQKCTVSLQRTSTGTLSDLITEEKWHDLSGNFEEIDLNCMDFTHSSCFATRMEALMCCLEKETQTNFY
ncbi:DgyrCDS4534 [Dimorphilus gyrociliatus]|uniref:Mediator of RNA polymerase II transcription subunit 17 n=1 Tax=Dimorphilus gyrociliatus TaxID=2664684 RepID=A0A7I8VJH7_9ANNE|nr:DgyrCDS4534 [Dimorphilus gyrociliatus]